MHYCVRPECRDAGILLKGELLEARRWYEIEVTGKVKGPRAGNLTIRGQSVGLKVLKNYKEVGVLLLVLLLERYHF